jgi:hypothetical protein
MIAFMDFDVGKIGIKGTFHLGAERCGDRSSTRGDDRSMLEG